MITPETWFKNGEALVAANRYGTAEFTEGLELLKKSALAGFTEAQVTLGHGHAQVHLLPNAFQEPHVDAKARPTRDIPWLRTGSRIFACSAVEYRKTMRRRLTGMRERLYGNYPWGEFA